MYIHYLCYGWLKKKIICLKIFNIWPADHFLDAIPALSLNELSWEVLGGVFKVFLVTSVSWFLIKQKLTLYLIRDKTTNMHSTGWSLGMDSLSLAGSEKGILCHWMVSFTWSARRWHLAPGLDLLGWFIQALDGTQQVQLEYCQEAQGAPGTAFLRIQEKLWNRTLDLSGDSGGHLSICHLQVPSAVNMDKKRPQNWVVFH